ncbi:unnamed protein product [Cunninghamella blakesleeana]
MTKCAWVTTITAGTGYVKGVIALQYIFTRVIKSAYPLLVLYTPDISPKLLELLSSLGVLLKRVEAIHPSGDIHYFQARFENTWTKLVAWDQDEYDRLVLLDADMLPLKNMDELMTLPFPQDHWVAASFACTCNPQKLKNYPPDWTPNNCAYTEKNRTIRPLPKNYFNSGLIVLKPQKATFQKMMTKLNQIPDLNIYPFPDQDFLNEEFANQWTELPYTYNALKTMVFGHSDLWKLNDIKNLHYILVKPWNADLKEKTKERSDYYPLYQLWEDAYINAVHYYHIHYDIDKLANTDI